jgi:hypothetical protein
MKANRRYLSRYEKLSKHVEENMDYPRMEEYRCDEPSRNLALNPLQVGK